MPLILYIFIAILIGYAFGCIQTAYLVGKLKAGIDIRHHGSNNAGASNITMTLGWKYGVITAVADILKGTIAVLLCALLFPGEPLLHFITGVFVVIGHIFPFFLGFKGGKGTASIIGISLALNFKIALIIAAVLVIITIVTNYIAIGSLAMYTTFPIAVYLFKYNFSCVLVLMLLCLIGYYKHMINIKRLLTHEEVGLRQVAKKK